MTGQKDEPLDWYKDAVIYEVHVRSFYDSNGDGIGDFRGLLKKLPFLHDLGVTAVWILPFYPSPLKDDGYDIADYYRINPDYGTLGDFQGVLREAHRLGIRVITELVLNHTSDQHAWFQKSRRAGPRSVWRDFYVWSDTPAKYQEARVIFKDFESSNWSWDPVAQAYYWHRFYSHQPDLNYDNPRVHDAMLQVIDFWLGMGVDGLRLDAVPYLYEREGTNCENLPETYAFLNKIRQFMDDKYPGRMLLAEANQWPEDAVSYLGSDACHMAFHFPLMPRMFMALQMEESFPIINILEQTPEISEHSQWALFLRNHDELTLEMVTDEERDYMYRVYASDPRARINLGIRRRLAPLMGSDRRKIELMNVLLFAMPGTPIIYYGDEIGMGDNYYLGDRNGVRTPMQWSPDRNAGFSAANPQRLFLPVIIDPEYHYEAVNVENQTRNPSSLLWWMRRLIDLRKQYKAFSRGTLEFIRLRNPKVIAMLRRFEEETILIFINLSRYSQVIEITSSQFLGHVPEDMFSRNRFPVIKDTPYVLILGPYNYHLLLMSKAQETEAPTAEYVCPELSVSGSWDNLLKRSGLAQMERRVLPGYLRKTRWFRAKGQTISKLVIGDTLPIPADATSFVISFIETAYTEGQAETYLLPLHYLPLADGEDIIQEHPEAVIARLKVNNEEGILYDAMYSATFRSIIFGLIAGRKHLEGPEGRILSGRPGHSFAPLFRERQVPLQSMVGKVEQSNTAVHYNESFFFKLYRRVEEGVNPEVEIGRFLTEKNRFGHVAPLVGVLEYWQKGTEPLTLGIMQGLVENQGDAWGLTMDEVTEYVERVLASKEDMRVTPRLPATIYEVDQGALSPKMQELMGGFYLEMVPLLGKRTAQLHLALSSPSKYPAFTPEPFSVYNQRSRFQSMRNRMRTVFDLLRRNLKNLREDIRQEAEQLLALDQEILKQLGRFTGRRFSAMKTRIHGDYHLGQVLYTGKDFVIIDFEGEPARSMRERRIKDSPLRDVAGMINSFQYAAYAVLVQHATIRTEDIPFLEPWAEAWYRYMAGTFLHAYLENVKGATFIPAVQADVQTLLDIYILDKAIHDLGYEINNRPDWLLIPLRAIQRLLMKNGPGEGEIK
jgi:maltose alpha-D-glucosyltransferase/alpha-amylase